MDRQTTTHVVRPHVNLITGRVAVSFFCGPKEELK